MHQVREPLELGPAPGVGLVEVDPGAEEVATRQGVDLAAHALTVRALRLELVAEEEAEGGRCGARCGGEAAQLVAVAALEALDEAEVEVARVTGLPGPAAHLLGHLGVLARGDDVALARLVGQGDAQPLERGGDGGEAGRDRRHGLLALGGHEVEDAADLVQRAPEHRDARAVDAGLLELDLEPGAFEEGVAGSGLAVVDGDGRLDRRHRRAGQCLAGVEPGRRVVGHLVLVAGHPDRGGGQRVEGAEVVDVGVADGIDGTFAHAATLVPPGDSPAPARRHPGRVSPRSRGR